MKKFIALLLAVLMATSLVACAKTEDGKEEQVTKPIEDLTNFGNGWWNQNDDSDADKLNRKTVLKIENTATPDMAFGQALEVFHSDSLYEYYFNCMMSGVIIVTYEDGTTENVKEAFANGHIVIEDLDEHGISYQRKRKTNFGNRNDVTDETVQENVTETAPTEGNE